MQERVIVAGAGPVGLLLACELSLVGVPVTVLERTPARPRASGGMVLHPRSLALLRQRGLAERFVGDGTTTWPRTHFGLMYLDMTELESEHYFLVPQWRTEQLLEERALELGVDIRRDSTLTGWTQDGTSVEATVRPREGDPYRLRGSYLVGCDGVHSALADGPDFDMEEIAPAYYGVLADLALSPQMEGQFNAGLFPSGQFGALPVNEGQIRLMTVEFADRPVNRSAEVSVDEVRASIGRVTGNAPDLPEPLWTARFGSATRVARAYRSGRLLLAGDAAHAHPPSAGDGLNTGLQDAVNLGWKLAAVWHGRASDGLLDTYDTERRPVGRKACLRAQAQVVLMHPLPDVAPLRDVFRDLIEIPAVRSHLVRMITDDRYSVTPPRNSPEEGSPHPLLGARFPETTISVLGTDGGSSGETELSALLHEGQAVLLNLSGTVPAGERCDSTVPGGGAHRPEHVRTVYAAPSPELGSGTVLIRPDGHIAWIDPTGADTGGLALALKALTA